MLTRAIMLMILATCWGNTYAAAAWVDDSIYVPIRAAANPSGRIVHRGIKSGTRIEFYGFDGGKCFEECLVRHLPPPSLPMTRPISSLSFLTSRPCFSTK